MKIGIIGFGAIGFDVAHKLDKEPSSFNVIGVHSRTKDKIIEDAFMYLGAPYLWGGRSPLGIDCSGLTQMVYRLQGIHLN